MLKKHIHFQLNGPCIFTLLVLLKGNVTLLEGLQKLHSSVLIKRSIQLHTCTTSVKEKNHMKCLIKQQLIIKKQ